MSEVKPSVRYPPAALQIVLPTLYSDMDLRNIISNLEKLLTSLFRNSFPSFHIPQLCCHLPYGHNRIHFQETSILHCMGLYILVLFLFDHIPCLHLHYNIQPTGHILLLWINGDKWFRSDFFTKSHKIICINLIKIISQRVRLCF